MWARKIVVFAPVFLRSAAHPRDFPADRGLEVALVGRSNSGKSTALNCLAGVRKLARVSKTPGRTQLVNFFEVASERRIVDLPGYGFARVPRGMQAGWQSLIETYLGTRESLAGLLLTVDVRRGLLELDLRWLQNARGLGIPIALLATKADKLRRPAALAAQQTIAAAAGAPTILFSALTKQGTDEARVRLKAWLEIP
jgi:GTP-binding protein